MPLPSPQNHLEYLLKQISEPHPKDFDSDETHDMSLESSRMLAGDAEALGPWSAVAEFSLTSTLCLLVSCSSFFLSSFLANINHQCLGPPWEVGAHYPHFTDGETEV